MGKKWSEIVSESPAGPLSGAELVVAVQGGQTVGLDYGTLKAWLQFKNNLAATTDPGVNDDSTAGYEPGSKWLNTNTDEWFICSLATAGAAVWEPLSLSADDLGSAALVNTGTGAGDVPLNSDLGSAAYAEFKRMPFPNILEGAGRFSALSGAFELYASNPFDGTLTEFFTPYNGSSISEAGKFLHNNTDFGGSTGSMTAVVLDLLSAMGRTGSGARYGVEFYVAEIAAGSGTAGGASFPSGTLALMTTSGAKAIFAADGRCTFAGWVRAIDGAIGFRSLSTDYAEIDGIEVGTNPEITPADGWVFVRITSRDPTGYIAAFPGISGIPDVSKLQIAIPSVFPGAVNPGVYTAPLPTVGTF